MQGFEIKKNQLLFSAFGNSPMGYALPASIGASFSNKKKKVICIDGDGSIQINIQELQTVKFNKLPIKIFIINNQGYGIIKQFQSLYLNSRFEASIPTKGVTNPNFEKISKAYGLDYYKINSNNEIKKILKKVFSTNKPEIIEVFLDPNQKIIPKLEFGRPIEDLSPLLPRKELAKIMMHEVSKDFKKIIQV
jgi:acetolactate synthase-1/2/3 large subunit